MRATHWRVSPIYPSLHFKQQRQTYYELLNAVRLTGDWETWLQFFADGVVVRAIQATTSASRDREQVARTPRALGAGHGAHAAKTRAGVQLRAVHRDSERRHGTAGGGSQETMTSYDMELCQAVTA